MLTRYVAFVLIFATAGCSSATLRLESTPTKAEVFVRPFGTGEARQFGETPLSVNPNDLKKQNGVVGPLVLEFRKEGFTPYRVLVVDPGAADLTVHGEMVSTSGIDEQAKLNRIIDQIFESQELARASRLEDAMVKLRELEREAPQIAAIYELEGGIYYIQKKLREALDAYTLAVKLNPGAAQSVRMRALLKSMLEPESGKKGASP